MHNKTKVYGIFGPIFNVFVPTSLFLLPSSNIKWLLSNGYTCMLLEKKETLETHLKIGDR